MCRRYDGWVSDFIDNGYEKGCTVEVVCEPAHKGDPLRRQKFDFIWDTQNAYLNPMDQLPTNFDATFTGLRSCTMKVLAGKERDPQGYEKRLSINMDNLSVEVEHC